MNNILEETLLNDLDMILLEEYPPIFMQLNKKVRDIISNTFAVGPNSRQMDIDRADVRKYGDGLIIATDEDFTPIGYMIGSNVGMLPTSPHDINDIDSRPKMLKMSKHLFYITPDEKGWEKIQGREKRGAIDKPEYENITRPTPSGNREVNVKREIPKGYKEEFNKRIEKYVTNKLETYKNTLDLIKKNIAKELEKTKKAYLYKVKKSENFDEVESYSYNKKISTIVKYIKSFDESLYNFKKEYKNIDKDELNRRITTLGKKYEDLKKELKAIK